MTPSISSATESVNNDVLCLVNAELGKRVLYLALKNVAEKLDCSTSTIKKWVKLEGFPAPLRMFGQPRWIESEVDAWVEMQNPQRAGRKKFESKLDQDAAAILAQL